jgi:hydrogenase maturation protein HypF
MMQARRLLVRGTVQGVGFRPFVARLAQLHSLAGWVLNAHHGVEIHVEGTAPDIAAFTRALETQAPPAAHVEGLDLREVSPNGFDAFLIRDSQRTDSPTARISVDLPVCVECLQEMFDPAARRFEYPYINCTNCGPRFSIIEALPYDRERTTMAAWPLCSVCRAEYGDPSDRRFHAEPVACPECGPQYRLVEREGERRARSAIVRTAQLLRLGALVAIKGIGGYHLSCDALNPCAVSELRARKYRKSRPFAVMARDLAVARTFVDLDDDGERLLSSPARPIVLLRALIMLPEVAPGCRELGVMLPYAPLHHLLFTAGAPAIIVMTSANRSSEPIAFEDADALRRLDGIADAFLVGDRPITRRVDDSVVRSLSSGPIVLRRGRGYAPGIVSSLPTTRPILAVGADLKNTITLVVRGDALVSQHIGDLEYVSAYDAFKATVHDLSAMYELHLNDIVVAHDRHPHYASTAYALESPSRERVAVQHHRAHIASVLAERGALDTRVVGVVFDGTGYGDDGTIWGGEFLVGSVSTGFCRVASLRPFALPGGDAAARWPVQAVAGFFFDDDYPADLAAPPFNFPKRYEQAMLLTRRGLRTFSCTSAGRLFDAAAALLGFTRRIEYEAEAAIWLENVARAHSQCSPLPFESAESCIDFRPALRALIEGRRRGEDISALARAFHEAIAAAISVTAQQLCEIHNVGTVVLSGGTFQNVLLLEAVRRTLTRSLRLWTNRAVPSNDGGISLGQAAIAAVAHRDAEP